MNNKTPQMTPAELKAYKQQQPGRPTSSRIIGRPSTATPPPAPQARSANQFYIGIDPGKNTGFALWERRVQGIPGRFVEVNTLTFWSTIRRLEKLVREFGAAALKVRIEDVRANKPTFSEREGNAAVRERMSQNVGSNKRDCQLIIDFLDEQRIPYEALPPRARAAGKGKVQASYFAGMTGFPTRSSEHSRDAAYLVAGL